MFILIHDVLNKLKTKKVNKLNKENKNTQKNNINQENNNDNNDLEKEELKKEKSSKQKNKKHKKAKKYQKNKNTEIVKQIKKEKKKRKKEWKKRIYGPLYKFGILFFMLYLTVLLLNELIQKPMYIKGQFVKEDENFAIFIPDISTIKITEHLELRNLNINDTIYAEYQDNNKWNFNSKNNIFKWKKLKCKIIYKNDYYIKVKYNITKVELRKLETYNIPFEYPVEIPIKKYFSKYKVYFNFKTLTDIIINEYKQ